MGKKILLADDSITIQKVIELTFSDEDFDVVTVGNGRLAVERAEEVRPDVVLCDIIMPEKDGYEVCDFIKKHPQLGHVPVLLLTGAFEPFDQDRAARVGCDGFLAKPFEPQTLIAKVKDLLAQGSARRGGAPAAAPPRPTPAAAPPWAAAPVSAPSAPVPPPPAAAPPVAWPAAPQLGTVDDGTSPSGVPSLFYEPRTPPAAPPRVAVPEPPAPVVEELAEAPSEFEVFYPTPEEIEPLAGSPEFEPVFAPSNFAPEEPRPPEEPLIEFEPAPAQPEPRAATPPAPAPPAAMPTFIPDEPFTAGESVPADEPVYEIEAEPELYAVEEPAAEPVGEPTGFEFPEDVEPRPPAPSVAAPPPPAPAAPPRWSVPSPDFPATDDTVRLTPSVPAGFEESFDEPALTLEADESEPAVPAAPASAAPVTPAQPQEAWSDEALFASEGLVPAPVAEEPAVPGREVADDVLAGAVDSELFTALSEEPTAPIEDSFDVPLGAEAEAAYAELEHEPEPEPLPADVWPPAAATAPPAFEAGFDLPAVAGEAAGSGTTTPLRAEALAPPPAPAPAPPDEVSFEDVAPEPPPAAPAPAPADAGEPHAAAVPVPMDMVEQIARRVVAQLGDKVLREVAWEVVPDLAEALIKREIERLKAELEQFR